jgi:hypothetical protein
MEFRYGLPLQVRFIPLLHHDDMVAEPYCSYRNDNSEYYPAQMAQLQSSALILPTQSFVFYLAGPTWCGIVYTKLNRSTLPLTPQISRLMIS